MLLTFLLAVTFLLSGYQVFASPGDDLYAFSDCLYQCEQITCNKNPYYIIQEEYGQELQEQGIELNYYNPTWHFDAIPLPLYLRLLGWTCESNCDYQCQRIITYERRKNNEEIFQFHGKWPFKRVFGIQELFSVIMSIGNFYVTFQYGFKKILAILRNKNLPYGQKQQHVNIFIITLVTMSAWIASAVFHTRDFPVTEHLDYYLAGATILSGFHALGARLFELYRRDKAFWRWFFSTLCLAAYAYHVQRLYRDWSYTYNMRANIFIGFCQNLFYCLVVYKLYSKYYNMEQSDGHSINLNHLYYIDFKRMILPSFYSRSAKLYTLYPAMLCTIVLVGMTLEIIDFPPICKDLVDAHGLWHLVTIVPVYMGWYDWLIWDVNENVWNDIQEEDRKKKE
ncbi:hypothetical protein KGF56_003866 [Candida oxycetoniae]|uniref:Post-GPI attachment to proteins factor 3 n=1 Tax=Candida oxycetoniae TaxID=497107 RepID=A0AAI9WWR3_9ASCO|nr:uncharacterized protein KGF56_003866 [Candida oxycetoniae]KAI3403278.2 hypothetical protein KGF56_003866 [Candida oxycetoniae]